MLRVRFKSENREIVISHRDSYPDIIFKGGLMLPNVAQRGVPQIAWPSGGMMAQDMELDIEPTNEIKSGRIKISLCNGRVVVRTTYEAADRHVLTAWQIAPGESVIRWNYLANFRNRRHYRNPYEQVCLYGLDDGNFGAPKGLVNPDEVYSAKGYRGPSPVSENTYSQDWQFAPHPSSFIFQAPRYNLLAACLELPSGFGMFLDIFKHKVLRWEINLGGSVHGQVVEKGETVNSPEFVFALDASEDVYHTARMYHDLLVECKQIPDPSKFGKWKSWKMPFVCTWIDQCEAARHMVEYHDNGEGLNKVESALTCELLDREIALLKKMGTPYGIFCIDGGWMKCRGDWDMDPVRMEGIRKRIDELHCLGMKVILWYSPFDVFAPSEMFKRKEWLCGGGVLNRHGTPVIDYSNPKVQEEYLQPLFKRLFSSEDGCCNADGIKTDFMADKIHPNLPVHDPSWRGEERFIFNTLRLMWDEGRKYKEDWIHQGCTAHPHFEQITSFNRCYDSFSTDYRILFEREKMVEAFQPGNYINTTETGDDTRVDLEVFFKHSLETGHAIEFGGAIANFGNRLMTEKELEMTDTYVRQFVKTWCS